MFYCQISSTFFFKLSEFFSILELQIKDCALALRYSTGDIKRHPHFVLGVEMKVNSGHEHDKDTGICEQGNSVT